MSTPQHTPRFVPPGDARAATSLAKWLKRLGHASATIGSDLRIANEVEHGYPVKAVEDVIDAGMAEADVMYRIVAPRRTLAHRKQKKQLLTPDQSDRLARFFRIYSRSVDALGDMTKASRWLHKENRTLQGQRPIELLTSDAGARAVEKILGRIEHGIFS